MKTLLFIYIYIYASNEFFLFVYLRCSAFRTYHSCVFDIADKTDHFVAKFVFVLLFLVVT